MEHPVITPGPPPGTRAILTLSCPDRTGIVHAVAGVLLAQGLTITEAQQFNDPDTATFFMRVAVSPGDPTAGPLDLTALTAAFAPVAEGWRMRWRLVDAARRLRTLIMVSALPHCLNDLLFRASISDLPLDVVGVVSNHPDLAPLAAAHGVPYHHIPVSPQSRDAGEAALLELIDAEQVDLVVLARYMQILSDTLCERLAGQVINIHHSMLPSFKGARPYHQAHARGVKLIGATAHYVTAALDEGPIIEQDFARVDHAMTPDDLARVGREVEARTLARAVRLHAENRVALSGIKTVVLS
ncbi:MAG TPA: formyltetrahydrofolate deformylase [Solirubrobacteraceae bacterium]|nr:formyltetrahydrofolate deformylase [Solirubrobacteraceae bacterium]